MESFDQFPLFLAVPFLYGGAFFQQFRHSECFQSLSGIRIPAFPFNHFHWCQLAGKITHPLRRKFEAKIIALNVSKTETQGNERTQSELSRINCSASWQKMGLSARFPGNWDWIGPWCANTWPRCQNHPPIQTLRQSSFL